MMDELFNVGLPEEWITEDDNPTNPILLHDVLHKINISDGATLIISEADKSMYLAINEKSYYIGDLNDDIAEELIKLVKDLKLV